jgi:solute carrier family 25 S-adenosylmethionine transporter 26
MYEMFKENLLERWKTEKDDIRQQLEATVLGAGAAGYGMINQGQP